MYGQIHLAVKDMVESKFGDTTWAKVLEASKLDEATHFMVFEVYPDSVTMALVGAVASTLSLPVEDVLRVFGEHFLTYCFQHGYDKMLYVLGGDFVSFVQNLDSLHSLLSFSYKNIMAPSFRCFEKEDGTILLHYYSTRKALYPIVQGILMAVGKDLFNKKARVTVLSEAEEEIGKQKRINHVIMQVDMENIPGKARRVSWALGDHNYFRLRHEIISNPQPNQEATLSDSTTAEDSSSGSPGTETVIREEDFSLAFPFHMVLDSLLCLRQCGQDIMRLSLVPIQHGTPLREVGVIVQPAIRPTIENVLQFINSIFVLAIHRKIGEKPLILKGQMIWMSYCANLLFMGSPRLHSFDEFKEKQMHLSDLPLYDATRELVLVNHLRTVEIEITRKLEATRAKLKVMYNALAEEKKKWENVLHEILPAHVAKQLMSGQTPHGEKFSHCTLLFSDVVTFTDISTKCAADDLINMLNEMFHRFDSHLDHYGVFKVETIGDAYMAVTGVPEVQENHARRMADFAIEMLEEASQVKYPSAGHPLKIRLGIHSGPVVAGVVGRKRPRYDLYGPTVNYASRMESTGAPGRIHVSKCTFRDLYPYGYEFLLRGPILVGDRGMHNTYFLIGSTTRKLTQPNDKYSRLVGIINPYPKQPSQIFEVQSKKLSSTERLKVVEYDTEDSIGSITGGGLLKRLSSVIAASSRQVTSALKRRKSDVKNADARRSSGQGGSADKKQDCTRSIISTARGAGRVSTAQPKGLKDYQSSEESDEISVSSYDSPYFGRHMSEAPTPKARVCRPCTLQ